MNKYDVKLCKCGRILVIPNSDLWDWMAEDHENRRVVTVCKNCGTSHLMWLDKYCEGFAVNSTWINSDYTIVSDCRVIIVDGLKVYMKSGELADTYWNNYFYNSVESTEYFDLRAGYRSREKWSTVDVQRLINDASRRYRENADNILSHLSGYILNIDWSGTKYESRY